MQHAPGHQDQAGVDIETLVLAGCAVGVSAAPSGSPAASPSPIPGGSTPTPRGSTSTTIAVAVFGRETCEFLAMTSGTEGDFQVTHDERYRCTDAMSDPRASGTSEYDISTHKRDPLAWYEGTAVLTTTEGTWRGTSAGAVRYVDGQPTNYVSVDYLGEGVYAGLRYTVFGRGSDQGLTLAGWIEPIP